MVLSRFGCRRTRFWSVFAALAAVGLGASLVSLAGASAAFDRAGMGAAATATDRAYAYVMNFEDGTISAYSLGASGNLVPLSPPITATSARPLGIAASPDGRSLYVTHFPATGSSVGAISQYDIDAATGALTPKTPASVAAVGLPVNLAVSPDGRSAYVADTGSVPGGPGVLGQFDLDPQNGRLTPKTPAIAATGPLPIGIAVSPDGRSVYAGSNWDGKVYQYDVDGVNGTLVPKNPPSINAADPSAGLDTAGDLTTLAVSRDGRSVYVGKNHSPGNRIVQFDVNALSATLSFKSPPYIATGSGTGGMLVSLDSRSLYVTNEGAGAIPNDEGITQYNIDPATGRLSLKSLANAPLAGDAPIGIAMSPDGTSVYVANAGDDTVSQYSVDPAAGTLQLKTPATVPAGKRSEHIAVVRANNSPVCASVEATPRVITQAHANKFWLVTLSGAIDPDGDTLSFHIDGVTQDEPVKAPGDGLAPDAKLTTAGASSNHVLLRKQRNPHRNGRVYRIAYTVTDQNGGTCSGTAGVGGTTTANASVQRKKGTPAVDEGDTASWNSFTGARVSGVVPPA